MKIVVVGKSGQVARALSARAQVHSELEVVQLGRPELDLTSSLDLQDMIAAQAPDVVINAAAHTNVDHAEGAPDHARAINALGAEQVALGASAAGAPVVQISTDYVFDGQLDRPYVEDDAPAPINVYGHTKLEGERRVAAANPRHIIARTAWVYSPWGKNFVTTMLRLAGERDEVSVVNDQWGSPTSALDLADALLAIAEQMRGAAEDDARWGIYHVAGPEMASWYDIAEATFETLQRFGHQVPEMNAVAATAFPTVAARPRRTTLASQRLADEIGIVLPAWRYSLAVVVKSALAADRRD